MPPVPKNEKSVCSYSAIHKERINIPDVYFSKEFDFTGPKNYDKITGYRTQSMMVIPLEDNFNEVIGVLQLINAQDAEGRVIPFNMAYERIVYSLASQAAIALTNVRYTEEIRELFESFVRVMSTAIDERTPYNANHAKNMAFYADGFVDYLNSLYEAGEFEECFDANRKEQFLMSVWLHDIGKLVTPLEVMNKATRLGGRLPELLSRFEKIELLGKIDFLEGRICEETFQKLKADIGKAKEFLSKIDSVSFLDDDSLARVQEISTRTYIDQNEEKKWLYPEETEMLCIRRRTLSNEEREIMENHVVITSKLLKQIKFNRQFEAVPLFAGSHHECIDGSGYPNKISGDQLPTETRMLAIHRCI